MNKFIKFNEGKLPNVFLKLIEQAYEHIRDENYKHAKNVWDGFKKKTMGGYYHFVFKKRCFVIDRCV